MIGKCCLNVQMIVNAIHFVCVFTISILPLICYEYYLLLLCM